MCQQGLPLTLPGVMSAANSGMTILSLVLRSDSFSCNCNSINLSLVNRLLRAILIITNPLLRVYIKQYFSNVIFIHDFNFVQQCIQISTRINSSMYIRTSLVCSTLRVSSSNPIFRQISQSESEAQGIHFDLHSKFCSLES